MFLEKPEDVAFFNKIIETNPNLEPYFVELSVWCYLYNKDKYFQLIDECKEGMNVLEERSLRFSLVEPTLLEAQCASNNELNK